MSARRVAAPPPDIEGYAYVSLVGSGGFSDVYCYQQSRPRRRVAIKVLLQEWSSESQRAAFDAEADLLASLSTHPSIVTMYEASVADDGRPYLAMEYCSRSSLGDRYRSERLSVPEVLRTAVLVSGAVETAHRAGILHRDIKPANLLVTDYGHPVLTDFGISATVDRAGIAEGMSIPWSPPESFAESPTSGVATDVWALAATTYSLLAGRSPFEVVGGPNSSADLIGRIEGSALPGLGRSDVPASLERVLGTAMAKAPEARYPSALALARALQSVQMELALAVTPIDVLDDSGAVQDAGPVPSAGAADWSPAATGGARAGEHGGQEKDDEAGTRLRQVVSIDPTGPAVAATPVRRPAPLAPARRPAPPAPEAPSASTVRRGGASPALDPTPEPAARYVAPIEEASHASPVDVEDTVQRRADDVAADPVVDHRSRTPAVVGGVVVALAAVGVVLAVTLSGSTPDPGPDESEASDGESAVASDNLGDLVPAVTQLEGTVVHDGDDVLFTWNNPDPQDGDRYAWEIVDPLEDSLPTFVDEPTVTVPADPSGRTCFQVSIVRDGRGSADPAGTCVQEP